MQITVVTWTMSNDTYAGPGTSDQLSLLADDDVFHLLSHHRKRAVLLLLAMAPHSRVHLQQIAQTLAALEEDCSLEALDRAAVRTRRRNLKRSHLDPLIEAGIIQKGESADVYVAGPAFSVVFATLTAGGYSMTS